MFCARLQAKPDREQGHRVLPCRPQGAKAASPQVAAMRHYERTAWHTDTRLVADAVIRDRMVQIQHQASYLVLPIACFLNCGDDGCAIRSGMNLWETHGTPFAMASWTGETEATFASSRATTNRSSPSLTSFTVARE
eukprot:scaffold746_cov508-Prasinococcus_capsulatus_cf.AAC.2